MNILLTGSGGFVGKNLKKYLSNDYNLICPRSFELNLVDAVAVEDFFNKNKIDCIIHCAIAGGYHNETDYLVENNIAMVENLLNNKTSDTKIILFGSGAMYDKNRDLHKVKEEEIGKFVPENLYGLSKLKIAELIKDRKDVVCLNIFGCYGYDEKETRFPTYAIKQVINNRPIEIRQDVVFDYLFIDDLCKIVEYFINNQPLENIINITPTESISLTEIAKIINTLIDKPVDIKILKKGMNFEYTGDNESLLKAIPNLTFTEYKEGLSKLFDYITKNY